MPPLQRVVLESPYAGRGPWPLSILDRWLNVRYARRCMRECFVRYKEAPFASHLLYTQPGILRDWFKPERDLGIEAGLVWAAKAPKAVIYYDRGITAGMRIGVNRHKVEGRVVEYRRLGK